MPIMKAQIPTRGVAMNFVYVPSEHLIVREIEGPPSEVSERVIAAALLP
jgi:hypothetical protein